PQDEPELSRLLRHPSPKVRRLICAWLADAGIDEGALDALDQLLRAPEDGEIYWALHALCTYASSEDARCKRRASAIAVHFLRSLIDEAGDGPANDVHGALPALQAGEEEMAVLEAIVASKHLPWIRSAALRSWARMKGAASVPRLCRALED